MKRQILMVSAFALFMAASIGAQTPAPAPAKAADITGQWTSTFESPVGPQTYTYDFVAKDGKLTGKMKGSLSEAPSDVLDGKIDGAKLSFGETLSFQGMEIKITYTGTIASADEIKLTRNVGDFGTEELVAKRVKKP
jgi:hypothetical protein